MENKTKSKDLIVKSNELIDAKHSLTATEQKIIYILTSKINKSDEDFKPYLFSIREFMDALEINNKSKYEDIKRITKNLMKKVFTIKNNEENKELQISWFSSVVYMNNKGVVQLEFSPNLKPYLLQLKNRFTQFDIKNVLYLRSRYSPRIYEFLKKIEKIGYIYLDLIELREKMGFLDNEYKLYADFKRYVILQAQKELKAKTDIYFEFEEVKRGRKVVGVKFYIFPNNSKNQEDKEIPLISNEITATTKELSKEDEIINILKIKTGQLLSRDVVKKLILEKGYETVKKYAEEFDEYVYGGVESIAAFFVKAVKNEYKKPTGKKKRLSNQFHDEDKQIDYSEFYDNFEN